MDGSWYFKLLREGRKITDIRDKLMFGEAGANIGDVGHQGQNRAAAIADTDEVCGCNGIGQGRHLQGHPRQGLVHAGRGAQAHKASASCGSCTGLVEQLIMFTAGGGLLRRAQEEGHLRLYRRPATRMRARPSPRPLLTSKEVFNALS